jgi:DNA gyrase subunit A
MVITISHLGYIKRTPLADFRQQTRGGIGSKAGSARDQDFIEYVYQASMHSTMMFFTEMGRLYWQKVYDLPEGNKQSKGRAIQNMINLQKGDKVRTCINVKGLNDKEYVENHFLIFITKNGLMKKTTLESYSRPRANGIIALGLRDGDELISVAMTDGQSEMMVASYNGKVVRFNENGVRPMGRSASGVKAITLENDGEDRVIGMVCVEKGTDKNILVISANGFGKRTPVDDEEGNPIYRVTNRGGKGVKTIEITEKTGKLVGIEAVTDEDDLMLMTNSGTAIRMDISTIRVTGRAAQGVKLIELQKRNDSLVSGCIVPKEEEENVNDEMSAAEPLNDAAELPNDETTTENQE